VTWIVHYECDFCGRTAVIDARVLAPGVIEWPQPYCDGEHDHVAQPPAMRPIRRERK
jgi:hypothetical protein